MKEEVRFTLNVYFVNYPEFLLGKIFCKQAEKDYENDQNDGNKHIPLRPCFEYRDSIVLIIHINAQC